MTGVIVVVGLLLLVVPGLVAAAALSVVRPIVVLERRGPVAAIRRSLELTRGRLWRVAGAGAALLVGSVVSGWVFGFVVGFAIGFARAFGAGVELDSAAVSAPISSAVTTVLSIGGLTALYRMLADTAGDGTPLAAFD